MYLIYFLLKYNNMNRLTDLLICIRNAQQVGLSKVEFPFVENIKNNNNPSTYSLFTVLNLLWNEGFIRGFSYKSNNQKDNTGSIIIYLKYDVNGNRAIRSIFTVSNKGRRVYINTSALWQPQTTSGLYVLSTPRGILSINEARRLNVGGEVLFSIVLFD